MTVMPTAAELGRIRAGDGRVYQITPEDVLWLARAARYEGGSRAATLWTWAWRFMLKGWRGSLASLVRAHSQPVNPAWDDAADAKCLEHPERCTPAQLARRAQAASAPFASLGEVAADVVRFAQAELPNPAPRASDFADPQVSRAFLARNPGARVVLEAGNWYIAEPEALALPADFVTIEYKGRVAGPARGGATPWLVGAGIFVVVLGIGAALWGPR